MLAQNFKTAADLGISEAEVDALIKVLGMLERGDLVQSSYRHPQVPNGFNMSITDNKTDCGTVGCIMGWCRFVAGNKVFDAFSSNYKMPDAVTELFMFGDNRRHMVSVDQAAIACRSYLTTGDANWAEALA